MTNFLFYLTFTVVTNWTELPATRDYTLPALWDGYEFHQQRAEEGTRIGEVNSNTIVNVVIEGKTNSAVLDSKYLGQLTQRWRTEKRVVYEPETFQPPLVSRLTNDMVWVYGGALTNVLIIK